MFNIKENKIYNYFDIQYLIITCFIVTFIFLIVTLLIFMMWYTHYLTKTRCYQIFITIEYKNKNE